MSTKFMDAAKVMIDEYEKLCKTHVELLQKYNDLLKKDNALMEDYVKALEIIKEYKEGDK